MPNRLDNITLHSGEESGHLYRYFCRYELEVDKTHLVEMMPEITLRAKNGIKLHLTPRD